LGNGIVAKTVRNLLAIYGLGIAGEYVSEY